MGRSYGRLGTTGAADNRARAAVASGYVLIGHQHPAAKGRLFTDLDRALQLQGIAGAIADLLHLAEFSGIHYDEAITDALRYWGGEVVHERTLTDHGAPVACAWCGQQVHEVIRWFEPCAACAKDGAAAPEAAAPQQSTVEGNLREAQLAQAAVEAYAARIGAEPYVGVGQAERERLLYGLLKGLRHLADADNSDMSFTEVDRAAALGWYAEAQPTVLLEDVEEFPEPVTHPALYATLATVEGEMEGRLQVVTAADLAVGDAFLNPYDRITRVEHTADDTLTEADTDASHYWFAHTDRLVIYRPHDPDAPFPECGCTWRKRCTPECTTIPDQMQPRTQAALAGAALTSWAHLTGTGDVITQPGDHERPEHYSR